jgi:hypothetical protein
MARILAIDWDRKEARCVLASTAGAKLRVHLAGTVPLIDIAEGGSTSQPDISGSLRAGLTDQRLTGLKTIVGLDRASMEVLNFTVPPAKDIELPELVINQAIRDSQAYTDDASLDFCPLSHNPAEPREIFAAVLSAERRKSIEAACVGAGLKPARIVTRPFAAASYLLKNAPPAEISCMLVNLLAEEADVVVLVDGRVVFVRTVRIPQGLEPDVLSQRLSTELYRTVLVAQQGSAVSMPIERAYFFAGANEYVDLIERLQNTLGFPVTTIDPFDFVDTSGLQMPGEPGQFASLLGMIADEVRNTHAIDFLHPRKPRPRPDPRRRMAMVAALVATVLAVGGYQYWEKLAAMDEVNQNLKAERKEIDESLKQFAPDRDLVETLEDWRANEIVWLDELRDLSRRLPASRDLLVHRLAFSSGRGGGGIVDLQGVARDASVISSIDQTMRDDYHQLNIKRVGDQPQAGEYPWTFERTMTVAPRDPAAYRESGESQP